MPSPPTIDVEALLLPIADERPSGEWLPDVHGAIEQARRSDDSLPQGDWKRETKVADWRAVLKIATDALTTRTKDLKTAAFLVEALVKEHGLPGLRDGLDVLRALQERFWDSVHPEVEDGDLDGRAAPFEWLNAKLPASIWDIAVTQSRDGVVYSLGRWEESKVVDNLARTDVNAHAQAIAEGKLTGEQFEKAVTFTPRSFYEALREDAEAAWEASEALNRVIDEKFGRNAPGIGEIRRVLEHCRGVVETVLKRKGEVPPSRAAAPAPGAVAPAAPTPRPDSSRWGASRTGGADAADGTLAPIDPLDREDALRRLAAVSGFFRRTEPHSPVAYLVERAVTWGQMPLEGWLREVIRDDAVLAQVRETLGLKDGPAPGGGES